MTKEEHSYSRQLETSELFELHKDESCHALEKILLHTETEPDQSDLMIEPSNSQLVFPVYDLQKDLKLSYPPIRKYTNPY